MQKMRLHQILKQLMAERGISARKLSIESGLPASTISSMLTGRSQHKPQQLKILADFFSVSLEFLLFGVDRSTPALNEMLMEGIFDGWLRVKIERAIPGKRKFTEPTDD